MHLFSLVCVAIAFASRLDIDAEFKLSAAPTDPDTVNRMRAYLIARENRTPFV